MIYFQFVLLKLPHGMVHPGTNPVSAVEPEYGSLYFPTSSRRLRIDRYLEINHRIFA